MENSNLLPHLQDYQVPPPFKDEVTFENFITAFFNSLETTISYDRYGRSGQKQFGLDVFSNEKKTIIQCKLKLIDRPDDKIRGELITDLAKDFSAFKEFNKKEKLGFTKFIFASTYKNDTLIHNECIKISTKKINVEYWSWDRILSQTSKDLKQTYFPLFIEEVNNYYTNDNNKTNLLSIDKKQSILEQVYQYIQIAYKEVNNIPNHILAKQYPFKSDNNNHSYFHKFNLTTNNLDLFNFFDSLKINDEKITYTNKIYTKGVPSFDKKTKTVLSKLTSNLIYNIISDSENKRIEIKYFTKKKCECIRCKLNKFEFDKGLPLFNKKPTSISSKLKFAYTNYQYGNFAVSAKLFLEISEEAKKSNLKIIHFICNYNLSKLKVFIRNNYWGINNQELLLDKIEAIDLDAILNKLKNSNDLELINWIKNNSFYSDARDKIQNSNAKIIDHYHSQLNGGWSSSSEVYDLINDYAQLDLFLNNNFIVYDRFSEFVELTNVFTEGLFASLSMNDSQNGKLTYFDDWIIQKLLFYGNGDTILKFFNRYNLSEINYKKTTSSNESDGFMAIIYNFFNNNNLEATFNKYCEKDNRFFWSKYNSLFENIIVLSSLCNLNKNQVNEIAKLLVPFIKSEDRLYITKLKTISYFIKRKGKFISKENLTNLLKAAIETSKMHQDSIIESLSETIEKHYGSVVLSKKHYETIELMSFGKCPSCNQPHPPTIAVYIYRITDNTEIKERIKSKIETALKSKFNDDLFYLAVLWDVIMPSEDLFNSFITTSIPNASKVSFKEAFGGKKDEIKHDINMLLNLCFKLQLDLSNDKYAPFRGLSNYYDWLFDMKNFNYDLFNPEWVNEYPTKYYFDEFRKYNIIQTKLIEYFKKKNDPTLERAFMNIYHKWID